MLSDMSRDIENSAPSKISVLRTLAEDSKSTSKISLDSPDELIEHLFSDDIALFEEKVVPAFKKYFSAHQRHLGLGFRCRDERYLFFFKKRKLTAKNIEASAESKVKTKFGFDVNNICHLTGLEVEEYLAFTNRNNTVLSQKVPARDLTAKLLRKIVEAVIYSYPWQDNAVLQKQFLQNNFIGFLNEIGAISEFDQPDTKWFSSAKPQFCQLMSNIRRIVMNYVDEISDVPTKGLRTWLGSVRENLGNLTWISSFMHSSVQLQKRVPKNLISQLQLFRRECEKLYFNEVPKAIKSARLVALQNRVLQIKTLSSPNFEERAFLKDFKNLVSDSNAKEFYYSLDQFLREAIYCPDFLSASLSSYISPEVLSLYQINFQFWQSNKWCGTLEKSFYQEKLLEVFRSHIFSVEFCMRLMDGFGQQKIWSSEEKKEKILHLTRILKFSSAGGWASRADFRYFFPFFNKLYGKKVPVEGVYFHEICQMEQAAARLQVVHWSIHLIYTLVPLIGEIGGKSGAGNLLIKLADLMKKYCGILKESMRRIDKAQNTILQHHIEDELRSVSADFRHWKTRLSLIRHEAKSSILFNVVRCEYLASQIRVIVSRRSIQQDVKQVLKHAGSVVSLINSTAEVLDEEIVSQDLNIFYRNIERLCEFSVGLNAESTVFSKPKLLALDEFGNTELLLAVYHNMLLSVNLLLRRDRELLLKCNKQGQTVLHLLAEKGELRMASMLFDFAKNLTMPSASFVDARDMHGVTPFQVAGFHGNLNLMQYFLKQGANPHAVDKNKNSALHYAVIRKQYSVVFWLLSECGLSPALKNTKGYSAENLARINNDSKMLELISKVKREKKAKLAVSPRLKCKSPVAAQVTQSPSFFAWLFSSPKSNIVISDTRPCGFEQKKLSSRV